ncbi:MAG: hypothetical protein ISS76_19955 [Phycisphaerae bacterium]|nr:hypothetical protein [Phycisphaerae bacterium]
MITFLQQAKNDKNTFAVESDPAKASHFCIDGVYHRIEELSSVDIPVENINNDQSEVTPLEVLTLNFGHEETTDNDAPLVAPSLF